MQFRARRTDLERTAAIDETVSAARAELGGMQQARSTGKQLEHLTAVVQLLDA